MFAQLFAVMAPVLAGAGVGYLWVRAKQAYPTDFVSKLTLNIGTPCLIISSLAETRVDFATFSVIAGATLLALFTLAMLGLVMCRVRELDWKVFVPAMIFPNTGNMGLPISLYAFGQVGFGYAVSILVVVSLIQFVFSVSIGSARPLRALSRTPTIYAIAISLLLMVFDLRLPSWLFNVTHLLAGFTIPLMLITLGVSLASIRVANLAGGLAFGAVRTLLVIPVCLAAGWIFGLSAANTAQLLLQLCMPVAVYNYMFAQRAGRSPELVAGLVFSSTLLSLFYLPVILAVIFSLE
ncbi:AEC family transporter [Halotalea alkalilenta]|uniref:AEC family transporter n=1 Tax=Halotalea alkalilenta TaxID=376489 RepID=UPI00047F21FC|nr:AEC family transporter [Halotalea alkalilenta]